MKAEKTFVGALAVLISLASTGCAASMSTPAGPSGGDRAGGGAVVVPAYAAYTPARQDTPLSDHYHRSGLRSTRMAFHAARL